MGALDGGGPSPGATSRGGDAGSRLTARKMSVPLLLFVGLMEISNHCCYLLVYMEISKQSLF